MNLSKSPVHAARDRLTSEEPFSQERIRRNSDESKHAETHYAREKVKDTSRQGEPKGEREKPRRRRETRERGSAGFKGGGGGKRSNVKELSSQGMSTRNGTRTRSRKEGRLSIRQIE